MSKVKTNLQTELNLLRSFKSAEQEAYLNLVRSHAILVSEFEKLFKQHDLSQSLYNVLKAVARNVEQGYPSQSLAQFMIAQDPDITRLVDKLAKLNLVSRERGTQDRRVVWVKITAKGLQKIGTLDPEVYALHRQQLSHMSKDKLQMLSELLVEARKT
mgnify:CR=1 FL=1